ncbi:MAG: T9SS type A sorting domain-containing protein [Saprospiraceae bacterium]
MPRKIILMIMITVSYLIHLFAQSQDLSLLSTGGGMQHTGSFYISYSIGEPFIEYKNNAERWISEGYQQPEKINLSTGTKDILPSPVLNIYPNPSAGLLYVELKNEFKGGRISIENTLGQIVMEKDITANNLQSLYIDQLDYGIYFLRVQQGISSSIKTSFIKI